MPSAKLFLRLINTDPSPPGVPLGQTSRPQPFGWGRVHLYFLLNAKNKMQHKKTKSIALIRGSQTQIDLDGLGLLHGGQR